MAREPDSAKANHLTGILKSARPAAQSTRLPDRSVQTGNGIQNIKKAANYSLPAASPFQKSSQTKRLLRRSIRIFAMV